MVPKGNEGDHEDLVDDKSSPTKSQDGEIQTEPMSSITNGDRKINSLENSKGKIDNIDRKVEGKFANGSNNCYEEVTGKKTKEQDIKNGHGDREEDEYSKLERVVKNGYAEDLTYKKAEDCLEQEQVVKNGYVHDVTDKKTEEPLERERFTNDHSCASAILSIKKHQLIDCNDRSDTVILLKKSPGSVTVDRSSNGEYSNGSSSACAASKLRESVLSNGSHKCDEQETMKVSLESLTESELRMDRDSEGRKSKNSIDGFNSSVRSRLDTDTDLEDMLPQNSAADRLQCGYDNLQVDSGVESAASSWDRMAEVTEHACARLQDELKKAHQKLKLKDEEVSRLSRIRDDVEAELEDLTASLFQEAHNMVREANVQQAAAEKALKESQMQIDVLTAEVSALKTLVLTSTPSRPNPHLHPQIDPKTKEDSNNGLFRKQHRRSPSHFNLKYGRENSPPESPSKEQHSPQHSESIDSVDLMEIGIWTGTPSSAISSDGTFLRQVDPNLHKEFLAWKQQPNMEKSDPFIARIYAEDINSCLEFNNAQLGRQVQDAIEGSSICIEAASDKTRTQFPKKCALLESTRQCHYRMRFDDCDQTYCISQLCRNRITAVCNFLNYLRYIQRGLVKSSVHDMYWEIIRLRKEIALARLGLSSSP